jgi:hypothetical protein
MSNRQANAPAQPYLESSRSSSLKYLSRSRRKYRTVQHYTAIAKIPKVHLENADGTLTFWLVHEHELLVEVGGDQPD